MDPAHERTFSILQESGYRLTGQRRAVIDAVARTTRAFSADELLRELAHEQPRVSRATVFRTLDVLVHEGVLDRIHRPDGCHSYVLTSGVGAHRHHLICSDCGTVVEFDDCALSPLLDDLRRRTNFEISDHWLEVFGRCASCQ